MRRTERFRTTVFTALSGVLWLGSPIGEERVSRGQEPPATTPRSLLSQMTWLRVDVVSGRLEPHGFRSANVRIVQSREFPDGDAEELQLINDAGKASLRFERRGAFGRRLVFLDDQGRVSLRHESSDAESDSFEYEQLTGKPLQMAVRCGTQRREFRTASVWHFAFEQPELAAKSLEPLIAMLRPGWSLMRESAVVREALQRTAARTSLPDRAEVERSVRQLASDRFAERKAADRRIRDWGPSVVPILDQWDVTTLDREQRERLRGIKEALGLSGPDTPQRVAQRLAADPRIWLAMLNSESADERQFAATQWERLTGRATGFDPNAAPAIRAARRDDLLNSYRWK